VTQKKKKKKTPIQPMRLLGWKALNCFEEFFYKKSRIGWFFTLLYFTLLYFDEAFKASTFPTLVEFELQ
jgi:hypothetical protein